MNSPPPSVILVGTGGYGLRHLRALLELHRDRRVELAGLVDVAAGAEARRLVSASTRPPRWYPNLPDALSTVDTVDTVGTVVIATPPHTHFELARTAVLAGTAVYLEKPPVPLLRELDDLSALPARRRVEVGFQQARATVETLERGWEALGRPRVESVVAHGALSRPDEYYHRSRWAGRWFLDGRAVLDGPLFNPLAHVVQAALLFANRVEPGWTPALMEAECFRVRPLRGDDTSAIRVTPVRGPRVVAVGTTAADVIVRPAVAVHTSDGVISVADGGLRPVVYRHGTRIPVAPARPASSALETTVTDPGGRPDPLLSLAATRNFVLTVNAVVQAAGSPHPAPVPAKSFTRDGLPVTRADGLGRLVATCTRRGVLLSEANAAWRGATHSLEVSGYRGLVHAELAGATLAGARKAAEDTP